VNANPRVVAANLRGFTLAYGRYVEEPYHLGEFVIVREGTFPVVGVLVATESGPEDPTRPLQPRGGPGELAAAVLAAEPHLRALLRTQGSAVACGYFADNAPRPWLPPVPAPLLAAVEPAADEEVARFTSDGAFLGRLAAEASADDSAIAAAIRRAAACHGPGAEAFRVAAGKELARLLRADPARLTSILRGVLE
jgi:hypothetical protein